MALPRRIYDRISSFVGSPMTRRKQAEQEQHQEGNSDEHGEGRHEKNEVASLRSSGTSRTLHHLHSKRNASTSEFHKDLQLELALNMIKKDPLPLWPQERLLQDHLVHPHDPAISIQTTRKRDILQENLVNPLHTATHFDPSLEAVPDEKENSEMIQI